MKKRLKGLVSLWLAAAMVFGLLAVPAMAADPVDVMVSTADTSPVPGQWHEAVEWASLEFDTPLIQQNEIMDKCPIPAGGVLNGWRLWSANSGGLVYDNVEPINIGKDDGIAESTWSSLADNMNDYLMIEQLWTMKYRIDPQPTNADPTVGGEVYDEATTTWSETDDVLYQWYEVTTDSKDYTVVGPDDSPTEDQFAAEYIWQGSYANGILSSTEDGYLDMLLSVQAGDVVTVTPSDGFSGSVSEYSGDEYTADNGTYTMIMTADKDHNLYIDGDAAFTATITVTRSATTYTPLDGQTSETLNTAKLTASGTYACKLTFNPSGDNVTLTSDEVTVIKPHSHPICGADCTHEAAHTEVTYTKLTPELAAAGLGDGSYYLAGDIEISTTIEINGEVNLCLNGYVLQYTGNDSSVLTVDADGALDLCDCNGSNGRHSFAENTSPWTLDASGTAAAIGGVITGGKDSGVYAEGMFNMYGGSIVGNTAASNGGAVYVNNGSFTMNGGTIMGNSNEDDGTTSAAGGGGVYVEGGSFTMNGGTISNNTTDYCGGGVYVKSGSFTMTNGSINENTALNAKATGGGVHVCSDSSFTMYSGIIANNYSEDGGGVYVTSDSTFTMNSGSINYNTAARGGEGDGGGVYVTSDSTFKMNGGTINENTAANANTTGGGVLVDQTGTFIMNNGAINGNKAGNYGGGVAVDSGTFTMNKGTIQSNVAGYTNSAVRNGCGGGVYVNNGTFKMNGGGITNNFTTNYGGGAYVAGSDSIFTMEDGTISANRASNGGGGCIMTAVPSICPAARRSGATPNRTALPLIMFTYTTKA